MSGKLVLAVTILMLIAPAAQADKRNTWAVMPRISAQELAVTPDGEITVAGDSFIRYSPDGRLRWRVDFPGEPDYYAWELRPCSDGGLFVIYGIAEDWSRLLRARRISAAGDTLWDLPLDRQDREYPAASVILPNGSIVIAWKTDHQTRLQKLDPNGVQLLNSFTPDIRMAAGPKILLHGRSLVVTTASGLAWLDADLRLERRIDIFGRFSPRSLAAGPDGFAAVGNFSRQGPTERWETFLANSKNPYKTPSAVVSFSAGGRIINAIRIDGPGNIHIDPLEIIAVRNGWLVAGTWTHFGILARGMIIPPGFSPVFYRLDPDLRVISKVAYPPMLPPGAQMETLEATPDGEAAAIITMFESPAVARLDSSGRCLDPSCVMVLGFLPTPKWCQWFAGVFGED